jgi:nitroreductase
MQNQGMYNNLLEIVKMRRSVRQFRPDSIPDDYIDKIIEVARWAPSGFHTQPWEFVVVKDKNLKDRISSAIEVFKTSLSGYDNSDNARNTPGNRILQADYTVAPVFIILLGDWRAKVGLPGSPDEQDRRVDNIFCSSLASAFLYLHLAVASLSLSSCWVSLAAENEPQREIKQILGIPEACRIYDMMAVGYGAHPAVPKILRNKDRIVHYDYFRPEDFRTNEEVIAEAAETKAWCISAH